MNDYTGAPPQVTTTSTLPPALRAQAPLANTGIDSVLFFVAAVIAIVAGLAAIVGAVYVSRKGPAYD